MCGVLKCSYEVIVNIPEERQTLRGLRKRKYHEISRVVHDLRSNPMGTAFHQFNKFSQIWELYYIEFAVGILMLGKREM